MFNEEYISKRIYQLRNFKNVSARDMSLSLGQNAGYINKIENKRALPSMLVFFYICDYFEISPVEFFDENIENPVSFKNFIDDVSKLSDKQINNLHEIVKDLKRD